MKNTKNGNGTITNLNLYNEILKKYVYEYQVPIAGAKIAAEAIYKNHFEKNLPVEQVIADSREWAQDCLPDAQHRDQNEEKLENVDLFLEIVQNFKRRGYPLLDAKIQAFGVYNLIVKEGWKDSADAIIDSSNRYAMETLPDLHR